MTNLILMKNIFRQFILVFLTALFLSGCYSHKKVEIYQKQDELLNCAKLTTKIADLIDINDDINRHTGMEVDSLKIWFFSTTLGLYNQYNAYEARDKLDKRLEYLLFLKKENQCGLTYREKAFIENKGRVSDTLKQN